MPPVHVVKRPYIGRMVRTLELGPWAGRWVAVDPSGTVQLDASSLSELLATSIETGSKGSLSCVHRIRPSRLRTALAEPWVYPVNRLIDEADQSARSRRR
jgi:hypothetical protein